MQNEAQSEAVSRQRLFTHETNLWLPRGRTEVFEFFGDVRNLQKITPDWLDFSILTPPPIQLRSGTRIDYKLKVHGLPVRWQTEITAWEPPLRFVDVQRKGPYRRWVHEHLFEKRDGGTLVQDRVSYLPLGGRLINWLFVQRDVRRIFEHRT